MCGIPNLKFDVVIIYCLSGVISVIVSFSNSSSLNTSLGVKFLCAVLN